MERAIYRVIGLMSGTSLDGVDLAEVTFEKKDHWHFDMGVCATYPYPDYWYQKLANLTSYSRADLADLDHEFTRYLGDCVNRFCHEHQLPKEVFLSSHGHTALHQPQRGVTYQLGNLPALASHTQRTVVCDFRSQDVALGGQGAPLVPIGDQLLFSTYDACVNLGGFANISTTHQGAYKAYDICAVNTVLNRLASRLNRPYDEDGKWARKGQMIVSLFDRLQGLDFYRQAAPKSLGVEWVSEHIVPIFSDFQTASVEDLLHTYTQHIALQIANQLPQQGRILITGGGAFNRFLIQRIQEQTQSQIVVPEAGIVAYKEALIFGFLGVLKLRNETNCLAGVTGAQKDHSSGQIFFP
jgi:anhydro-N-acetylmuramic acid kinase